MSTNVEPEEAAAIRDLMSADGSASPQISERSFKEPRRLSTAGREGLVRRLRGSLATLEEELALALSAKVALELRDLTERDASGIFDGLAGEQAALRFSAGGQPCWLLWEPDPAVAAVERLLGSAGRGKASTRRLSRVEAHVIGDVLGGIAGALCAALKLEPSDPSVAQSVEALGTWLDAEQPDAYRLSFELGLRIDEGESTLAVHLPYVAAPEEGDAEGAELPAHLSGVEVQVQVQLEGCEVQLEELLALRPGDVIPIDARVGDPANVLVEGQPFAQGTLGQHRGSLAVLIQELVGTPEPNPEEEPS